MRVAWSLLLIVLAAAGAAGDVRRGVAEEEAAPNATTATAAHVPGASKASCPKGSYYWGLWQEKHYCVKCPAGTSSTGCTNCLADPRRTTCTVTGSLHCKRGARARDFASRCAPRAWSTKSTYARRRPRR